MKKSITITIDKSLLAFVEELSKLAGRSRSEIIEYTIRKTMRYTRDWEELIEASKRRIYDIIDRQIDDIIRQAILEGKLHGGKNY